jgi:exodeoxyribonuclease-3
LDDFQNYIAELIIKRPNLIIAGDYNICHKAIDIHNPVSNANSSGFLPEEREWIEGFINNGFIDSFRHFNKEPHNYTWWSFRAGSRDRNLGWRIDYQMVSKPLENKLKRAVILPEAKHSDHCPVLIELDF